MMSPKPLEPCMGVAPPLAKGSARSGEIWACLRLALYSSSLSAILGLLCASNGSTSSSFPAFCASLITALGAVYVARLFCDPSSGVSSSSAASASLTARVVW